MNEQNTNNVVPNMTPEAQGNVTPVQPVVQEVPVTPVAPITPEVTPAEVVADAVAPANVAPVEPALVMPAPTPAPVVETQSVAPATVEPAPAIQPEVIPTPAPAPVVEPTPVIPAATVQPTETVAPTAAPAQVDIVPSEPINPIANNATATPTIAPTTIAPSTTPANDNLTTPNNGGVGFVATSSPLPKKTNKGFKYGIIAAVIVAVALLGYFVIFPLIVKTFFSNPMNVYEATIKAVTKEINTTVNDVVHTKAIYDVNLTLDSNMTALAPFSGYTYNINAGVDPEKQDAQLKLSMFNSDNKWEYENYLKDGKKYGRYSTYKDLIYLGELTEQESNEIFGTFKQALQASELANDEEINYIVTKVSDLIISGIDENKLIQEETTINIDGENTKVTNNKYVLDKETYTALEKHVLDGLRNDKEAVKILAKLNEVTEEEMIKALTPSENNDGEFTTNIVNIYTSGMKNMIVGFALTQEKTKNEMHFYFTENYSEFKYYSSTLDEETNKDIETELLVTGKVINNKTNVTIKYNDKEVAKLYVKQCDENKVDLTYEITADKENVIKGNFTYNHNDNGKRIKDELDLTINAGSEKITIGLDITLDWTSEVANINTGTAVTLTEQQIQAENTKFMNSLNQSPIGVLFQTISGLTSGGVQDYYTNDTQTNVDFTGAQDNTGNNVVVISPEE